jgi:hypothetical protein
MGQVGTITHLYGVPSHRAVDVKFDDGRSELFWYYQLDETADDWVAGT